MWLGPKPSIIETSHPKEDNNSTLSTTTNPEVTTDVKYFNSYEFEIFLISHMIVFVL